MVLESHEIAGLIAADLTGDAVRKKYALLRQGIGAWAETASAIADVTAHIKSGPAYTALGAAALIGMSAAVAARSSASRLKLAVVNSNR